MKEIEIGDRVFVFHDDLEEREVASYIDGYFEQLQKDNKCVGCETRVPDNENGACPYCKQAICYNCWTFGRCCPEAAKDNVAELQNQENDPDWQIPDSRDRRRIFFEDLKLGRDFCIAKYGVSKQDIDREAERLFSGRNL